MPSLFVLKNLKTQQEYRIQGTINLGRSDDNDIVVESNLASRNHCRIECIDDRVFVKDLNSGNGTYVNGNRIHEIEIVENSELRIGDEQFSVSMMDETIESKIGKTIEHKEEIQGAKPELQGILIQPIFKRRVKGCVIESVHDISKKYIYPVNSIFTVGRLNLNDIFIDSEHVSRNHAKIEVRERQVVISDINSTNGTFVNGDRVKKKSLSDGDVFSISGEYDFMISIDTDESNCLRSLKNVPGFCFVDVLEDSGMILDLFRDEFGEQTLLEVERQTVLFCNAFENVMRSKGRKALRTEDLKRFLTLISKASMDEGASPTEHLVSPVNKLFSKKGRYRVVYFEVPDEKYEDKVHSNGFLVTATNESHLFISGVPYENLLYMIFASDWLSQLNFTT